MKIMNSMVIVSRSSVVLALLFCFAALTTNDSFGQTFRWTRRQLHLQMPWHYVEPYVRLAGLYASIHDYTDAVRVLETIRKEQPERPDIDLPLASYYLSLGNLDMAEQAYNRAAANPSLETQNTVSRGLADIQKARANRVPSGNQSLLGNSQLRVECNRFSMAYLRQLEAQMGDYARIANQRIKKEHEAMEAAIAKATADEQARKKPTSEPMFEMRLHGIRSSYDGHIYSIENELDAKFALLIADTAKKIQAVETSAGHLRREMSSIDSGTIQPTAQGTGIYVRNYINYGQSSEPQPRPVSPLRAKQDLWEKSKNGSIK